MGSHIHSESASGLAVEAVIIRKLDRLRRCVTDLAELPPAELFNEWLCHDAGRSSVIASS
jgi:hypothetical protein